MVGGSVGAETGEGVTTPAVMPFRAFAPGAGSMGSPPVVAQPLPPQSTPPLEMMRMVFSPEEEGRVMRGGGDDLFSLPFEGAF